MVGARFLTIEEIYSKQGEKVRMISIELQASVGNHVYFNTDRDGNI